MFYGVQLPSRKNVKADTDMARSLNAGRAVLMGFQRSIIPRCDLE